MKVTRLLIMLIAFSLFFGIKITKAQDEGETKPEEELTEEQWQQQITDLTTKKTELTNKVTDLQKFNFV